MGAHGVASNMCWIVTLRCPLAPIGSWPLGVVGQFEPHAGWAAPEQRDVPGMDIATAMVPGRREPSATILVATLGEVAVRSDR
jgi:hypothetical protein